MPARPAWRAATIIAAVPVLAAMLLAATDTLAPAPALALAAASAGWGLLVGSRWKVDEKRREAGHAAEFDRVQRAQAAATAALQQRLETERAITEALPDPLIVLGADRQVIRVNPAAQAAFGTEMGAVLRHPGLRAAIERSQNHPAPQTADLTLPVPVERDVHATVFALDRRRVAAVLSDRTRERALERMRADFVANASHELRTPLASLIGFIDTLRGPAADDPPAQIRFLGIMAEQAARMNRLIDDLLSLSRIELNEHQTPTTRLSLPDLLHRMAASFRAAGARAGHNPGCGGAGRPARHRRRRGPVGPGAAEPAGQRGEVWPGGRRGAGHRDGGAAGRTLAGDGRRQLLGRG